MKRAAGTTADQTGQELGGAGLLVPRSAAPPLVVLLPCSSGYRSSTCRHCAKALAENQVAALWHPDVAPREKTQ
ncbi:hypothetical protein NGM37_55390, partial [Streptomyces sp. TRM76130]|nr:hypothetical protein [Streptomyces sp. TRM76130]